MERRGSESPLKLPLAPIIDRRGAANTTVSTRRGSSIFSPTQTLDHHHLRPQPPPHVFKPPSPDPDPAPDATTTASPPQMQALPPPPEAASDNTVRYRECLKNHAASMGGHVVDGCGEFMPIGAEGTPESLRCAACDCHRNFHRKEVDGEAAQPSNLHQINNPNSSTHAPFNQQHPFAAAAPAVVNFGGGGDESSSEDLNMLGGRHAVIQASSRKRFRTKFSQEQKDRMQEVAEKLGWRIQKQDEEEVQRLCRETGVKRQVFKVWMHNNKQAMKKKRQSN